MGRLREKQEIEKSSKDVLNDVLPTRYRLKCKNHIQKDFANLITDKEIVIASGPAGVGKSYVAVARALELLQNKTNNYNTIVISTPAEEAGENLGYLPGNLREKMEPYLASTLDIFDKIIGKKNRLELEEAHILKIEPLGFIRGKSIDNTILIMEEAQNMSPTQMKTLLTRIGENSKFIISGDLDQSDRFKNPTHSGLYDAINRHNNIDDIAFIKFETKDIVRNPLITKILDNYKNDNIIKNTESDKKIIKSPIIKKPKEKNNILIKLLQIFKNLFKW